MDLQQNCRIGSFFKVFYLFVLVLLVTLLAGPTIFVVHTFCHINASRTK